MGLLFLAMCCRMMVALGLQGLGSGRTKQYLLLRQTGSRCRVCSGRCHRHYLLPCRRLGLLVNCPYHDLNLNCSRSRSCSQWLLHFSILMGLIQRLHLQEYLRPSPPHWPLIRNVSSQSLLLICLFITRLHMRLIPCPCQRHTAKLFCPLVRSSLYPT